MLDVEQRVRPVVLEVERLVRPAALEVERLLRPVVLEVERLETSNCASRLRVVEIPLLSQTP